MTREEMLEAAGVEGSDRRDIIALLESVGAILIGVDDVGHPSKLTMIFDYGCYLSRVTIEDVDKRARSNSPTDCRICSMPLSPDKNALCDSCYRGDY